jgi:hypothetical protein
MSTTFWVKIWRWKYIDVAFRGNFSKYDRWLNELAPLLPDETKLKALDNTQQWINTIWDFKKLLITNK